MATVKSIFSWMWAIANQRWHFGSVASIQSLDRTRRNAQAVPVKASLWISLVMFSLFTENSQACIWDSKTLSDEKKKDPTLAQAILSPAVQHPIENDLP